MLITIKLDTNKTAFRDNEEAETARLVRTVARAIELGHTEGTTKLFDSDDHPVGSRLVR